MIQFQDRCWETVSLFWALLFGARGACIEITMWSVLALLIPFAAAVMLLQYVVKSVIFGRGAPPPSSLPNQPKAGQRMAAHLRRPEGD
ncbi:hypothetical protein [Pseudoruegeria sp. HB172150]|uniref:hypothetical protein n=1 Tax=Pseudoruegeria sp. HB172150 TaxID=2721164 RepID=UPI001552D546|nr:hypothetical protein [Pseudoruegeria sp. HB172150]